MKMRERWATARKNLIEMFGDLRGDWGFSVAEEIWALEQQRLDNVMSEPVLSYQVGNHWRSLDGPAHYYTGPQPTEFAIWVIANVNIFGWLMRGIYYELRYALTGRMTPWMADFLSDIGPHHGCSEWA